MQSTANAVILARALSGFFSDYQQKSFCRCSGEERGVPKEDLKGLQILLTRPAHYTRLKFRSVEVVLSELVFQIRA